MTTIAPTQSKPNRFAADSRAWSPKVRQEVIEMLQECLSAGTQCEDADIDHEFNHAIVHLLTFAERPGDLLAHDAPSGLDVIQRFNLMEGGTGVTAASTGQYVRYEDAAKAVYAAELKLSTSDYRYDSDRAFWNQREADLLALIGTPSSQPIHQWREDADELWEDCSKEEAERSQAKGYEARTVYCLPADDLREAVAKENTDLRLQCGGMEMEIRALRDSVAQLQYQLSETDSEAIQGVEPVAKCGRGNHASFCTLTDYGRQVVPVGSNALYLASQIKNGVLVIPDNLLSHRRSWRAAFERLIELEPVSLAPDRDDRSYWEHEMRALDRMYSDLDRIVAEQKKPTA
ncbi:hypothetical protein [Pseudomonas nitroreducens]|uniref:hypothetical protein n=1 Tax=Pseudomonas nitroreducens TaxID=46680 RepID=UPI00351D75F5